MDHVFEAGAGRKGNAMSAYSKALAGESISDAMNKKWDSKSKTYIGLTFDEIERYARTIAYKVAHNLSLGFTMDPANDPLTYVDCGEERPDSWCLAPDEWKGAADATS